MNRDDTVSEVAPRRGTSARPCTDMIIPWSGVRRGDLALSGGGLVMVDDISTGPGEGHPEFLVACVDGRETDAGGVPSGRRVHLDPPAAILTAVRRPADAAGAGSATPAEEASAQQAYDCVFGAGALNFGWWLREPVPYGVAPDGTVQDDWHVLVRAANPGAPQAPVIERRIGRREILDAARAVVQGAEDDSLLATPGAQSACGDLLTRPGEADFSDEDADELLQTAVYGQPAFGAAGRVGAPPWPGDPA